MYSLIFRLPLLLLAYWRYLAAEADQIIKWYVDVVLLWRLTLHSLTHPLYLVVLQTKTKTWFYPSSLLSTVRTKFLELSFPTFISSMDPNTVSY